MRNYDLSQLASQVPGLIKEVSKKRQPQDPAPLDPLDLNTFFDFSSFYGEEQGADPDSRSRSNSSTPELTSGSSEEDGAPSPGPNVDSYRLKAAVKKVKQQDDRFTVPQREIRPKGALPYPCKIQLDHALSTNPSGLSESQSPTGVTFMSSSPSSTSSISFDVPATRGSPINRGKRTSPLKDASRVAEIRKIGACSRCKTRKVQCNEQVPCTRCLKDASKYCGDDNFELAKQMCIRHLFHINDCVFQAIGDTEANRSSLPPSNGHLAHQSAWTVSFGMIMSSEIEVPVVGFQTSQANGLVAQQHELDKHNLPQDSDIIRWASHQMARERESGLQFALDNLLAHCVNNGRSYLPHFDIIEKVYQMRCWYRVWRQNKFFCQYPGGPEEVPDSIRQGLRNIAKSRMKGLEPQILEFFEKQERAAKSPQRLLIWASMMQMILLYRDMYNQIEYQAARYPSQEQTLRMAENLFSKLVVTCELHFGKKKPERMAEDGNSFKVQVNSHFNDVERHYKDFHGSIRQRPRTLDHHLIVLQRGSTGGNSRSPKRARR